MFKKIKWKGLKQTKLMKLVYCTTFRVGKLKLWLDNNLICTTILAEGSKAITMEMKQQLQEQPSKHWDSTRINTKIIQKGRLKNIKT